MTWEKHARHKECIQLRGREREKQRNNDKNIETKIKRERDRKGRDQERENIASFMIREKYARH